MVFPPPPLQYIPVYATNDRHADQKVTKTVAISVQIYRIIFFDPVKNDKDDVCEPTETLGKRNGYHTALNELIANRNGLPIMR